jgi:hypothetical protein
MYSELYEYLILNRQLSVPGIGTFFLERKPAETDLSHRQINAAAYTISLKHNNATPNKKFFYWLAEKMNISFPEAIVKFNGFSYDLKNQVMSGNKVVWDKVGTLSKWLTNEIRFEPDLKDQHLDPPVSATKIIREKAEHTVRVGEEEKTSAEMSELLSEEKMSGSYWWAPALIAAILLIIVLAIYFSQQGVSASAVGNQQKLAPPKADSTYKILP